MSQLWPSALRRLYCSAVAVAAALVFTAAPVLAQEPANQAGLIVEYGDGSVDALCVEFTSETITGAELLQQSGLEVGMASGGMGLQVCMIGYVGCDPRHEQCWCQCLSNPCAYWTYFQWQDGAWSYSSLGAASRVLENGEVDAWVWGDGKTEPVSDPETACAQSSNAAATAEVEPTGAPEPTPTAVTQPSRSPAANAEASDSSSGPASPCASLALVVVPLALMGAVAAWRR